MQKGPVPRNPGSNCWTHAHVRKPLRAYETGFVLKLFGLLPKAALLNANPGVAPWCWERCD